MRTWRKRLRTLVRQDRGAAVVEFALVVPFFFLLVWGGLVFSRAYQRLNVLTASLREGARYGATIETALVGTIADSARARVDVYSNSFGFRVDTAQVSVTPPVPGPGGSDDVVVSVTNYPLFNDLTGFFGLNLITVSRSAVFRWERAGP